MINIKQWMKNYAKIMTDTFTDRVCFIGLQGSHARNEAKPDSDIDVVLILDKVTISDLKTYKQVTASIPNRHLLCGFVSGKDELANWSKHDLFQFYHDTLAIQGNLTDIIPTITAKDAQQAVLVGACNIYHACSHNFLHSMDRDALSALYKAAFFVLQAKVYYDSGIYIKTRSELKMYSKIADGTILQVIDDTNVINADNIEAYTSLLLDWTGKLIVQYS